MDRLSALIVIALVAVAGCEDGKSSGSPPSRVNAAKTAPQKGTTIESFCDVHATPTAAAKLAWPALAEAAPPPAKTWRWINVWATWCKPCIEEMPRLAAWKQKLGNDLVFVSVDESADAITRFRSSHPDTPASLRLADGTTQEAWFARLGLQGAPPIPIHVFVDPQQRVRCVRAGGVRDQDYAIIEALLGS